MERIVNIISYQILSRDATWEKDFEVLKYSVNLLLESTIIWISFILISVLLDQMFLGMFFCISLILMRNFFGGGHTSSFKSCFFLSNCVFTLGLNMLRYKEEVPDFILVAFLLAGILITILEKSNRNATLSFLTIHFISFMVTSLLNGFLSSIACCFFLSGILTKVAKLTLEKWVEDE